MAADTEEAAAVDAEAEAGLQPQELPLNEATDTGDRSPVHQPTDHTQTLVAISELVSADVQDLQRTFAPQHRVSEP